MPNIHKPFHQKYRPNNLDELVGQKFISITLKQALLTKKIAPAYLFNGPRGTGKTSSARIFAKSLNCQAFDQPTITPCCKCDLCRQITDGSALDIIEIDAASNTGVENIREIIERARFAPTQARWKVYVIDECHMLSMAASNALLKTIEEPPSRVVFILATTNPERVLNTIKSRCQKFDFRRISPSDIFRHLSEIAEKESIKYEVQALKMIAKRSNGGMRDAQSLLEQLNLLPEGITINNIQNLLGEVSESELTNLIQSLIENNPESLIETCNKLYDAGNEPLQIIIGLLNITRDLLLHTSNNKYSDLYYTSDEFRDKLDKISKTINKSTIINWHNNLRNIEYQIKSSDNPRLWFEIHLTGLLDSQEINSFENKQESKNNTTEEKHASRKNIPINKENIPYEIPKPTIQEEITHKKLIEKKDEKLEKFEVLEKKSIENISENNQNNPGSNLKDKWELILSKVELPSTRMLLSQQAELESFDSEKITIALSPNWESMIKSRKVIIENTLKKIFGDGIILNFSTKQLNKSNPTNTPEITQNEVTNFQPIKKIEPKTNSSTKISNEETYDDSSKNLANFFNGEIIDLDE
ncbi:DNA polymerase III subunit gamma/tau [Prochlorococcus marinus str. XMU1401]|uniref:DNA polymerase III subunit gamma/tau n=1 Tax=Prochlorococcus marinus str. XMU1401 TaxID=2052594 RepID=A0A8I2BL23_PROMR|nr:DNA polymerase III subunit gamma/tau [Prochlorococcus marinus]MBO8223700.1 DNA polymerase III subunit gamma/tau [Prochlorococcus marinus str. XMU1401]MBW3060211.1 DNA polymerase III subunit gamma/tau [Prochlorococcus marinus str. XMU1401E]MCQ9198543.1 DNA polymerase III subunit gamma/tau [Prochlorococcus marinus XMU1429]PJC83083.1 DNA polymerase III subunit gamma/tau [Prochlorococcus marinus str. XMU1401]